MGFVILRPNEKRVSDYLFANSALRMRVMLVKGTLLLQPDVRLPKLLAFDVSPGTGTPVLDLRPMRVSARSAPSSVSADGIFPQQPRDKTTGEVS